MIQQRQPGKPPLNDFGYEADPEGAKRFLATLNVPFFAEAAPEAMTRFEPEETFLHTAMHKAHQASYGTPFVPGRQLNGSCVAWGAAHAVFCAEAVEWTLGNRSDPPLMPSTESIYGGSRVEARRSKPGYDGTNPVGGWSDGSTGYRAAKWLSEWGVIYRKDYGNGYDLTNYDKDLEKTWGARGNGGIDPDCKFDQVAAETPCRHVVNVRTWNELCAAIGSGYPVTIASNVGFKKGSRDADGFLLHTGQRWAHQMVLVSTRFDRPGALCINSWGGDTWVTGPKYPPDQPPGSFWIDKQTVEKILGQGDSWAIAETEFKWRKIRHDNWLMNEQ